MKKIWLIMFLGIVILLGGCAKQNEETKKEEVKERELEILEKEALLKNIDDLEYFDYLGESFRVADLNNQDVLQFVYELVGDLDNKKFSELESIVGKYLNYSIEPENIICKTHYNISNSSEDLYLYDSNTDTYLSNSSHLGHGSGGFRTYVFNKFISGKTNGDVYEVVVSKVFSSILGDVASDNDVYDYYSSYKDAVSGINSLFSSKYDNVLNLLNSGDYDNKLVKYKYTFKLKNGNYLLTNYEIM